MGTVSKVSVDAAAAFVAAATAALAAASAALEAEAAASSIDAAALSIDSVMLGAGDVGGPLMLAFEVLAILLQAASIMRNGNTKMSQLRIRLSAKKKLPNVPVLIRAYSASDLLARLSTEARGSALLPAPIETFIDGEFAIARATLPARSPHVPDEAKRAAEALFRVWVRRLAST